MNSRVAAFIRRRWRVREGAVAVETAPLQGGLESAVSVARITNTDAHPSIPRRLIVKELQPGFEREALIYELLWRHLKQPPAVHLLGRQLAERATYLYLEEAQSFSAWPWGDSGLSAAVCRELARLHDSTELPAETFSWDYERQLACSAEETLKVAMTARDAGGRRYWKRIGDLKRMVAGLPTLRAHLLSAERTVIHGDMHPGNVIVRQANPRPDVVLIDWARARIGSPLEDLASWIHSLGCWEPEARRRHDTLMRAYLNARAFRRPLDARLRLRYWLASVSNGLSGSIRYHLAVLTDRESARPEVANSHQALATWQRIVRRSAALAGASLRACA